MVKELTVKISDELHEQLEKLAEKVNKSKADIIRDALLTYIGVGAVSDKPISDVKSHTAPALYSGKCSKCSREIKQGDIVGFIKIVFEDKSKKTFVYCLDCYYSLSDKQIVQLEIRKAKLERTIRALTREKNRLIREIDELEKLTSGASKLKTVISDLDIYINQVFHGDNEALKKLLVELTDLNNLLAEYVRIVKLKKEYYLKTKTYKEA